MPPWAGSALEDRDLHRCERKRARSWWTETDPVSAAGALGVKLHLIVLNARMNSQDIRGCLPALTHPPCRCHILRSDSQISSVPVWVLERSLHQISGTRLAFWFRHHLLESLDGRLSRVDSEATGKLLVRSPFTAPPPEKNVISEVFHLCLPRLFKLAVRAAPRAYHSGWRLHIKQTARLRRAVRCSRLFWVERGQNGLLIAIDVGVQCCASAPGLDRGGGLMCEVWASFNVVTHVEKIMLNRVRFAQTAGLLRTRLSVSEQWL